MLPGSPNPDAISNQKMSFSTHFFQTRSLKTIPIFGFGLIYPVPGSQIVFNFRVCAFSIQQTQLSRSLEQARPD